MQGNVLFVGCSHTQGYWRNALLNKDSMWQDNNYAKIFAEDLADSQCYIYAQGGTPNSKYPRWIKHMLDTHNNISKVVVQSTYWDRWVMGTNKLVDYAEVDVGHFTREFLKDDNVICYDDFNTVDFTHGEWSDKIKVSSVRKYTHGVPLLEGGIRWQGYDDSYMHMKFHTEVCTHLTHQQYCKDIALIDHMCAEKNIPVYVWRINERVDWPEKVDLYSNLNNTKFLRQPASDWIMKHHNIDIEKTKVDEEHYSVDTHKIIAHEFIPELIND
jgi:hypothetical protein